VFAGGGGFEEGVAEFRADLIARLADRRADGGVDAAGPGAELGHRGDGGLQHAAEGAFPAGMRRADHAGFGVREQDRRTVRRQDAQAKTRQRGDHGVGLRAVCVPGFGDVDDVGRMDLVAGEQGIRAHGRADDVPVLGDGGRIVVRARPALRLA
jgi:hypothetical protein